MESKNGKHFASFAADDQTAGNTHTSKTSVEMVSNEKFCVLKKKRATKKPLLKKSGEKPTKKKGFAYILSTLLLVVGIGLLVVAGVMFGKTQLEYHEQDVINEELATYATVSEKKDEAPVIDWAGLQAVNNQVVGWIQIPDTQVNYPVYQTTDNDHYLHTNAKGEWSIGGQISWTTRTIQMAF